MTLENLRELARHAADRTVPENFSLASVDQALADGFKALTGSVNAFMKNRYDIYDIVIENADRVVPTKVMEQFGQFAEIRNVRQGETVMFKRGPLGRNRAKKFLTQVGLSGVYESFRLDKETFSISMKSIGGAVSIDFERMLDGAESLAEFMDVLAEAQVDAIYGEVQGALIAAASHAKMPAKNKVDGTYSATALQNLVNTVKAYGNGAVIFASPEFVAAMGPDAYTVNGVTKLSAKDMEDIHDTGSIKMFRGTPIVELRQSFLDESNTEVMVNPQFAYVLPTGGDKVVKIVMEGQTQMYDHTNVDQSIEVFTYRKIGVGIVTLNNWGIYKNTGIDASAWYNAATLDLGGILPVMNPGNGNV